VGLGKAFGRRWLFRRLSFTVPQGTGLSHTRSKRLRQNNFAAALVRVGATDGRASGLEM
jgi:hypothetical protein